MGRVGVALRIAAAVAVATSIGFLTALQVVPKFELPLWLTLAMIAVVALAALEEPIRKVVARRTAVKRQQFSSGLDTVLTKALLEISELTGYHYTWIGVSAFRIAKPPWWKRNRTPYMDRIGWRRFADQPQRSPWRWTIGVGAIGISWNDSAPFYRDLRAEARKWIPISKLTPERFGDVPARAHMGMSYEMFRSMIPKYGEVSVMPIVGVNGEMLGCLSLDVALSVCDTLPPRFKNDDVSGTLAASAAVVAGLITRA